MTRQSYPRVEAYATIKGLTLDDIAGELGIVRRTLNEKISGKRDFTLDQAIKLSNMLGQSMDDIFLPSDVA